MISFAPYYRKERKIVLIRIIVDGVISKNINTGIKLEPEEWDAKERKVVKHPNKKIFNQKIQNKIAELQKEVTKAELLGVLLTRNRVKKISEGAQITTDFHKWAEYYIKDHYPNKGTQNANTADHNRLKAYAPSLQFGDIDARWLTKYEHWLKEHFQGNTPWKSLKFVRKILYAAGPGIVHHNPFEHEEYKLMPYNQPLKDGLYIEELDRIEAIFDKPVPVMLKIVAAKFLFMCYTGLRISDAKKFRVEDHLHNGERIIITSQKTGVTTNLKIYGRLARVLERLQELPEKKFSDKNFNEWLKTLAEACEIDRIVLTSHVGRHTLGCLLAELNIPIEVAQKIMGHKRTNTTKIYYNIRQSNVDDKTDRLNSL